MTSSPVPSPPSSMLARSWMLLILVAACLFFVGLGRLPLLEPDEGRNAEVAREMLASHDWITPHYDTLPYLDKPAFLFWIIAGSFRCFGISEWAARFPSALMGLVTALLVWLMGRNISGATVGLRAGVILATAPLVFGLARSVIFDMTLTFFVSAALYCFWLSSQRRFSQLRLELLAFGAMGIATLTKGPVGFLLPLMTLAVYQALRGRFGDLKKLHWAPGCLVFFAITLPWFIEVSLRNPGFPKYAFWEESLLRFATGAHLHRSEGYIYYIPVYFAGFFPWSFFLLAAGWNRLKSRRELRQERHRAELFLLSWAGVIFVFFTISRSKLPGYFLPALVPLSVLMAIIWRDADLPDAPRPPDWLTAGCATMILIGILMAATHFLRFHGMETHWARRLPPSVFVLIKPSLFLGGILVAALGFLARNMAVRTRKTAWRRRAFVVIALTIPLVTMRWIAPLKNYFAAFSSRQLAETILQSPQRDFPVYGYYYFRTSLPFYLQRPVGLVTADGDEITSKYVIARFDKLRRQMLPFPAAPPAYPSPLAGPGHVPAPPAREPLLISGRRLRLLSQTAPGPFLLMVRNNEVNVALQTAGSMSPLWEGWKFSVWEKQP